MQIVGVGDLSQFVFSARNSFVRSSCFDVLVFLSFFEDILDNGQSGKGIGPTSIEGNVRQHFRGLSLGQSVIHRSTEVIGDLRDLPGGNQRAHGNQASITRRESGAKPKIAEQKIGRILHEPRRGGAKVGAHLRCPLPSVSLLLHSV